MVAPNHSPCRNRSTLTTDTSSLFFARDFVSLRTERVTSLTRIQFLVMGKEYQKLHLSNLQQGNHFLPWVFSTPTANNKTPRAANRKERCRLLPHYTPTLSALSIARLKASATHQVYCSYMTTPNRAPPMHEEEAGLHQ